MLRSLWTAASGMRSEQVAVDNIANNIANVNTTAYKSQSTQFKSLLYQTLQAETTTANGETKPTAAQVGLGTRVASVNASFTQGALLANDNKMACAIEGSGFYSVQGVDGQIYYTRDGNFGWTLDADGSRVLANSAGLKVMSSAGQRIVLPNGVGADTVSVGKDGLLGYRQADGTFVSMNTYIGLYQFQNPVGLEKQSGNLYAASEASGEAINERNTNLPITPSTVAQGYLEGSNVNIADEMVSLIISQRAYELNSKAITTSDSMLETANNLKR